jgi:hypothetical protein
VASSESGFAADGPLGGWPRRIVSASLAADDPRGLFNTIGQKSTLQLAGVLPMSAAIWPRAPLSPSRERRSAMADRCQFLSSEHLQDTYDIASMRYLTPAMVSKRAAYSLSLVTLFATVRPEASLTTKGMALTSVQRCPRSRAPNWSDASCHRPPADGDPWRLPGKPLRLPIQQPHAAKAESRRAKSVT